MEVVVSLTARQLALLRAGGARLSPPLGVEELLRLAASSTDAVSGANGDGPRARAAQRRPGPVRGAASGLLRVAQGEAACAELGVGDELRIAQVEGGQCADVLVWAAADASERLSASATRTRHGVAPTTGARLRSGWPHERDLVEIVADTAPGHDLLHPACSSAEYASVGAAEEPSCAAVQAAAAGVWGLGPADLHDPLNLWFRPCVRDGGELDWRPTPTAPGDEVVLRALVDVRVVVNPCVDDVFGCARVPGGAIDVACTGRGPLRLAGEPVAVSPVRVALEREPTRDAEARLRARAVDLALAALGHAGARSESR